MVKTTSKTPLIIVAAVVVVAVIVGVVIAVNSGNKGSDNGGGSDDTSQTDGLTASELANVDQEVAYGDFETMQTLSKSIQNGEMTGKVVKVEGLVSHPATSYSITQRNADNTMSVGTVFKVEGWGDKDYPADKAQIEVTGKVVEDSPMVFIIKTLPDFVVKK